MTFGEKLGANLLEYNDEIWLDLASLTCKSLLRCPQPLGSLRFLRGGRGKTAIITNFQKLQYTLQSPVKMLTLLFYAGFNANQAAG